MVTILLPQTKHSSPLLASMNDGVMMEPFQNITIVGWVSCGHPIDMFTQQETIDVLNELILSSYVCCIIHADCRKSKQLQII